MLQRYLAVALLAGLFFGLEATGPANNNLFLPGDAFFPTALTKESVEALQKEKVGQRSFRYSSFGGYPAAFCGYAGYENAVIPAVDDRFAKNLLLAYQDLRKYQRRELQEEVKEDGKTAVLETNGMQVLFYPAEFNFPKYELGLQYNENWIAETMKFGHRKQDIRMCSLFANSEAVEHCWRDADEVPALPATLPDVVLKTTPQTKEPVVVQGKVKAIVVGPHATLASIFQSDFESTSLSLYIVDSEGLTTLTFLDGEWKSSDDE